MKHRENQQQSKHVCDIVGNERKKKEKKGWDDQIQNERAD